MFTLILVLTLVVDKLSKHYTKYKIQNTNYWKL